MISMLKRIDMFWLIVVVTLATYCFQMILSYVLNVNEVGTTSAFFWGNLTTIEQAKNIKAIVKACNVVLIIDLLCLIFATDNKISQYFSEEIIKCFKSFVIYLIGNFGFVILIYNPSIIAFIYMVVCLLPLIKYKTEEEEIFY